MKRNIFLRFVLRYRRPLVIILHLILIAVSNYLAFWLRFEGIIPYKMLNLMLRMLPLLLLVRGIIFALLRLYEGLWRYTSIWDLQSILVAVFASSVLFFVLAQPILGHIDYPRSVFIVDTVLLIFFLGAVRLPWRVYREVKVPKKGRRVLVYGAGDAGEMIVRDMRKNPFYDYEPIGFIDDNASKVGQHIHGVRVMGTRKDLTKVIERERPNEVLVAIPTAEPAAIREILRILEPFKMPIKTLPNLRDVFEGKITVSQIRNLAPEDLLARIPVDLEFEPVRELLSGRRVLITGAGGSIGSELSRQVAGLSPRSLVLVDRYENGLFSIINELIEAFPAVPIFPVIGDVTDANRMNGVFAGHQPEIVFHAAAHKHVPLMEANPCEAVKNNVTGTRILAETANRYNVEKLILISTDKAVNPTSVMGATKRIGEMILQTMAADSNTSFVAVRFGNVLASNGSVVPTFMEQIKRGGPVTVTHPEIRRYFMLIPEAVQLVLHAAARGSGNEIYVLDMGEQIKIVDMARNLIRLSGFVPDEEIQITYVGLRPGEKLHEELIAIDELAEESGVDKIHRIKFTGSLDPLALDWILELEARAAEGSTGTVLDRIRRLVPTFQEAQPQGIQKTSAVRF